MDPIDLLKLYVKILDDRNLVLTTPDSRFEFMQEMYVTHVLGRKVETAFDLIASNDVEDLSQNTRLFQLMQQYTIYPIWDLYKLTWDKFIEQPMEHVEFQIKMAKKFQIESKAAGKNLLEDENTVTLDESTKVNMITNEVIQNHQFKKSF